MACLMLLMLPLSADEAIPFVEKPASRALIASLRTGGYVLYLRHGQTDSSIPDQVPINLDDCSTQRPLTDIGRTQMRQIGVAIRKAGIPLGQIFVSPMCRAQESARLAFGPNYQVDINLMYTAHLTSAQKVPIIARTRELLSTPVTEPGKNRVILAHAPNLADLMDYYPETEGTMAIFRPLGDAGFEYLASILPQQWQGLTD
jgi:phosphohistidine phosphatase SixA